MNFPLYLFDVGRESETHPAAALGQIEILPQYILAFVPGGTFFFTIMQSERRRKLLTEHIDDLWAVFKATRQRRPFIVGVIVILPHYCIAN